MRKKLPSIVLFLMAGALLIYTSIQTYSLLKTFLPGEQAPLAILGLVAFDGGLLGWSYYYAKGARGSWQRDIAALMIVVSIFAVVLGFGAETFFQAGKKGMLVVTQEMSTVVVWAICGVIAANVVAVICTHLLSPENRKAMAEEDANDVIQDAIIEAIKKSAPVTAAHIVPGKVEEWVTDRIQMHLPTGRVVQALPAPQPVILPQSATITRPAVRRAPAPVVSAPPKKESGGLLSKVLNFFSNDTQDAYMQAVSLTHADIEEDEKTMPTPAQVSTPKSKHPVQQLVPKKALPALRPSLHDKKLARFQKLRGQSGGTSNPLP